jgi:hypothetical protein
MPSLKPAAVALVAALGLVAAPLDAGRAQSRATIVVAETVSAEAAAQAPLSIRVGPPGALPRGSFVRIRGLPTLAALSDGHSIAPGSWAVPLLALSDLKITLPVTAAGRAEIVITLVAPDGSVLAEARSILSVSAPSQAQAKGETSVPLTILRAGAAEKAEPPPLAPPGRAPKLAPEAHARALRLMQRGDEQLAQGGIAQARLFYERAAEVGLADAAMALAATYDAAELGRLGVLGLQPDSSAARRWYERARQLGAAEAEQRLTRLGAR